MGLTVPGATGAVATGVTGTSGIDGPALRSPGTGCVGLTGLGTASSTGTSFFGSPVRVSTPATGTFTPVLSVTATGVPPRFTVMLEPSSY